MTQGGYRQPENPAPVSGVGERAERTDGGPGSDTQPIRVPSGGPYGQRQQLTQAQQAQPLPQVPGPPVAGNPTGGSAPAQHIDPFGPSQRPGEPGDAGVGQTGPDPDILTALRMINAAFPSTTVRLMIERAQRDRAMGQQQPR